METARPLIDERRHEFAISLPPEPIWLYADPSRLEQVVTNLLNNAAKYTNEGGRIWLSARQEDGNAVLRVRDNGRGIDRALLPNVFDIFTQAERSSDRSQGGLGLGLALSKRLVEMHEGTIGVSSALGQGSEFVVTLPVCPPGNISPKTPPLPLEMDKATIRTLRVLVVDDNVAAARILEMLIQASGHTVRLAHTGSTALATALKYRPDVMLVDIGLPEIDGFEVARRIRQQPETAGNRARGRHRVWTGLRSAAIGESGVQSPPGQARRLQQVAANLGGGHGEGDLTPTNQVEWPTIHNRAQFVGLAKERKLCQGQG